MNARLFDFERAAYFRDHERALSLMIDLLKQVEKGASLAPSGAQDAAAMTAAATRMASAIVVLFADPKLTLSQGGFERLVIFNRALNVVFGASAFEHSGHLMRAIAKRPTRLDEWRKLLVVATLDAFEPELVSALKSAPAEVALPGLCALLTGSVTLTETAEQARAAFLRTGRRLRKMKLTDPTLETLAVTWMTCSYGHAADKHDIKSHLNHLLERWLSKRGVAPSPAVGTGRERPRLVVCAEWWTAQHAMYRCYGPSVEQLRSRFEVVLVTEPSRIDDVGRRSVDRTIEIPFQTPLVEPFVAAVSDLRPDVILYPSLGMAVWSVCLANLRLAPLQLMTLGHPAPSRSRHIDFVLTEVGHEGAADRYTERLVLLRKGGHPYVTVDVPIPASMAREHEGVVLAVPSNALKLSATFLSACRRIEREASRPVSFEFFHHQLGLRHRRIETAVSRYLDRVTVHPRSDYATYLRRLNQCDVHLGVFPFGGTNSNIDTMRLGLPMVSMRGAESHATGETEMLERAGIPAWLLANDQDGYVNAALRLVDDPDLRRQVSAQIASVDVDRLFMSGGDAPQDEFVSTVWWLFGHHQALAEAHKRVYYPDDRRAVVKPSEDPPRSALSP